MSNISSLLKKIEKFEKIAFQGNLSSAKPSSGKKVKVSIAQDLDTSSPDEIGAHLTSVEFSDARRYLQLAKDQIKDEMLSKLLSDKANYYKYRLANAPQTVSELQNQSDTLNSLRVDLNKLGNGDPAERATQVSLSLGRYLSLIADNLKGLREQMSPSMTSKPEVGSANWTGATNFNLRPQVQLALNQLLDLNLKPDGKLGPQTAQAIQLFKDRYDNTKHVYDPSLHTDIMNAAKDQLSGLTREVPF